MPFTNILSFIVSGTYVVQPNILLNNGVMHLIDGGKCYIYMQESHGY